MIDQWKRMRWLPISAGMLLCAIGFAAFLWPQAVMNVLPILLGIAVLALGFVDLMARFIFCKDNPEDAPPMLQGFVSVAVGIVLLFNRTVSLVFIGVVLGLLMFIGGAVHLRDAWIRKQEKRKWLRFLFDAIIKMILGLLMMFNPISILATWTQLFGLYFVVSGASVIASAHYLNETLQNFKDF